MIDFDSFAAIDNPSPQVCHFTVPVHFTPEAGDGGNGTGSAGTTVGGATTGAVTTLAAFDAAGSLDVGGVLPD
jgi:hypothetical protein